MKGNAEQCLGTAKWRVQAACEQAPANGCRAANSTDVRVARYEIT